MDRFVFKRTTVPTYEENDTLPHVTFQFGEKSPKSHKKAKKHRKEQRKMRRDIDCLSKEVKQLQREIQNLRDHDSDGFIILQRKR